MQYILNAAFDVHYFMHIYLTSFLIINLEVANFVIFKIFSIFSSTVFIGVNNIFCFFYKWPNFPPHYTFSFFQKVMTEIKLPINELHMKIDVNILLCRYNLVICKVLLVLASGRNSDFNVFICDELFLYLHYLMQKLILKIYWNCENNVFFLIQNLTMQWKEILESDFSTNGYFTKININKFFLIFNFSYNNFSCNNCS